MRVEPHQQLVFVREREREELVEHAVGTAVPRRRTVRSLRTKTHHDNRFVTAPQSNTLLLLMTADYKRKLF